jgi:hypothetical protein
MEGTKQPYAHQYLWSITLSRIFIPLYFFGCPKNFMSLLLGHRTDSAATTLVLIVWLLLQAAVLELQVVVVEVPPRCLSNIPLSHSGAIWAEVLHS